MIDVDTVGDAVVLLAIVLAVASFEIACVRDVLRAAPWELRYMSRAAWLVACVISVPVGGMLYLWRGRMRFRPDPDQARRLAV